MPKEEAKRLPLKTVVIWDKNPVDLGTVLEHNFTGFFVEWANGERGWIDYQDAQKVSVY